MRHYISDNQAALEVSLGSDGLAELRHQTDHAEQTISSWKDAEPRIWGHIISRIYKLLNWKAFLQHSTGALAGADRAAEVFLHSGIERWEAERRLPPAEAALLRSRVAFPEARNALQNMGVHLVLSVAIAIPIPGLRSAARFSWTAIFWVKAQAGRLLRRASKTGKKVPNIHTPLVMVIALIPAVGGVAYLAARPLRKKLLIRLILDQAAWKLPFRLYGRMHLGRWLAPTPERVKLHEASAVTPETKAPTADTAVKGTEQLDIKRHHGQNSSDRGNKAPSDSTHDTHDP